MPSNKVTMRQKIKGEDRTIVVSERSVPVWEDAGWKVAPKTMQPEPAPES